MLLKSAIAKFEQRRREDVRALKQLTEAELEDAVSELPHQPPIWRKLRRDQRVCLLLGARRKRFAFFCDTGFGKTMLSLALIRYFQRAELNTRVLVLVPRLGNKSEWSRLIRKHAPRLTCCILAGSSKTKWRQLEDTPADVVLETYAGFTRMVCRVVATPRRKTHRLAPQPELVARVGRLIDGLILDESHHVSNHAALPYRICRELNGHVNTLFELTGTPFGRDPSLLWSQLHLIDGGYTLGETLGLYRATFFNTRINFWGGYEHTFLRRKQPMLNRFLAHSSIRFEVDEMDLPNCVQQQRVVNLPAEAASYYQAARASMLAKGTSYRELKNAFVRMRQISSGFVGFIDDDNGERASFEFPDNPKLDALLTLLEGINPEHKVIVFHDFQWSGERIARELQALKIGHLHLYGRTGKDVDAVLKAFDHDPKKRVLLLSNQLAIGLNLQAAKYGVYYESPVPVIIRTQATARFVRPGSTHKRVFLIDLVVRKTVDEAILRFHAEGKDLMKAILNGKFKV
jgi:SNF2 family DNA or RNA helicase